MFGGKQATLTPLVVNLLSSGWPGALSSIKGTLKGSPLLGQYFLMAAKNIDGPDAGQVIAVIQTFSVQAKRLAAGVQLVFISPSEAGLAACR